jgi:hypothetical protein
MDLKWDVTMKPEWAENPVVHHQYVELSDSIKIPATEDLLKTFKTPAYTLQTWKRSKDITGKTILENDPHWIAVRGSTPLHIDPRYPRYSHHLKLRVDPGIAIRGHDKVELQLVRGLFYILDTHSPHQVTAPKGAWNVAVSIDSKTILPARATIAKCLMFAASETVTP